MSYILKISGEQIKNIGDFENLLLNLSSGLRPEDLTKDEVNLLKEHIGENWFEELGYEGACCSKPEFE